MSRLVFWQNLCWIGSIRSNLLVSFLLYSVCLPVTGQTHSSPLCLCCDWWRPHHLACVTVKMSRVTNGECRLICVRRRRVRFQGGCFWAFVPSRCFPQPPKELQPERRNPLEAVKPGCKFAVCFNLYLHLKGVMLLSLRRGRNSSGTYTHWQSSTGTEWEKDAHTSSPSLVDQAVQEKLLLNGNEEQ